MSKIQNLAIIQARMSSSRLPGKVLEEINGSPAIKFQIDRLKLSSVDEIVVATSTDPSDDVLVDYLNKIKVVSRRGPLNDVANRFEVVLDEFEPVNFLRLTADCPFVMPNLLDEMLRKFSIENLDYLSNTNPPTFPDGLDIEIVRTEAFRKLLQYDLSVVEREHVTLAFAGKCDLFNMGSFANVEDLSDLRWTLDYPEDLEFLRSVAKLLIGREHEFTLKDVLSILKSNPDIRNTLGSEFRNIGLADFSGTEH